MPTTRLSNSIAAVVAVILCVSCSGSVKHDCSDFVHIDETGWVYGDTLCFVPACTDSVTIGALTVTVCHDDDYTYANLWLEVSTSVGHRDTINMLLANKYGQWYGQGFGTTFQVTDTVADEFTYTKGDTIRVRHIMRVDTLTHLSQVGVAIKVEK